MRKFLLMAFTMLVAIIDINAEVQCDVILTTNNFQIPCIVVKTGDLEVQYKECHSEIDKLVIINVKDIRKIYMSDGTIMDYTQKAVPVVETMSPAPPQVVNVGEAIMRLSPPTPQRQEERAVQQKEQSTKQKPKEDKMPMPNIPKNEAYDIILTTDENRIEARITEVSKSEIRYKEKDNIDGPTFVLETVDIHSILYANGKVVRYNKQSTDNESNANKTSAKATNVNRRIKYTRSENDSSCPCANVNIEAGEVYKEWGKWLDYINIVERINIRRYRSIYVFPIDISQIRLPEQSNNQYLAIAEALESFPDILREHIFSKFNHLNVIVVDIDDDFQMPEASIGLCLRFDEFELISKDSGIQKITLSGVVTDNTNNHLFNFTQRHLTIKERPVLVNLQKEFKNFAEDICRIMVDL